MNTKNTISLLLGLASIASMTLCADPVPTGFTYQGILNVGTNAANGHYDFRCAIYDAVTSGTLVGPIVTNTATAVANGYFDVWIWPEDLVFQGEARWLEMAVRTNGGGGFVTLTPRQQITPAPYALYAPSAGTAASAMSATNFSGTVSGDVAGTQGATVVASVGGQTAASVASGVIAANAATSANTPNTVVARDASGSFSAQSVTLDGVLNLPSPAIIYSGSNTMFIESGSIYAGAGAGAADFAGWPHPDLLNVGIGDGALNKDNLGMRNTAVGEQALQFNTSGSYNTAVGEVALKFNVTGDRNTAIGEEALYENTIGTLNVANGHQTLGNNTSGSFNSANGAIALFRNTTGNNNTAEGYVALQNNTSGINNIGVGYQAGQNLTTGNNNIDIGNPGVAGEGNTIRVGVQGTQANTYVAGIWETSLGTDVQTVVVDSAGHLGTGAGAGSGVTTVTGSGDIIVSPTSGNVVVGSDATSLDTFDTIVKRDSNGGFAANNIWLGTAGPCGPPQSPPQSGVLNLPTTTPTAGMITLGGCDIRFLHGYGSYNLFGGAYSGNFTMTGGYNTGLGYQALGSDTTGDRNTGVGAQALYINTTGNANTANGSQSLFSNTSGSYNTAVGEVALKSNTTGDRNTAIGEQALYENTIGTLNVANGHQTLGNNTSGSFNSANGAIALFRNTTGNNNTAEGYVALQNNTSGINNIGVGYQAGQNLTTGNNNIDIGNPGVAGEGNTIRVGVQGTQANTYVAGIWERSLGTDVQTVVVDSAGHLGTGAGAGSGVTSVTGSQHITAMPTTGTVVVGSDATSADVFSTIVSRDGNGSFNAMNIALGSAVNSPSQTGVLNLSTTTPTGGMITLDGTPVLHAYGSGNSFVGGGAGNFTMTGTQNTANGGAALSANTTGSGNTASGTYALYNNSSGNYNTAIGDGALNYNTTGDANTGIGLAALNGNTSGSRNTAEGFAALSHNNGSLNTANGYGALTANTVGGYNTACGAYSLGSATGGARNIALGYQAGFNITTGDNNIDIGNTGVADEGSTIRIGVQGTQTATFVAGIYDVTLSVGAEVYVNSSGQLGTKPSSRQFKQDIRAMADASDVLLALRPVAFRYKAELDPKGTPQFGLIAEEVDKVNPDLVVHDEQHGIYTVRYEAVNAMLLNEFLKQHRKLEEQNGEIAIQNAEIGALKEKAAKVDLLEKRLGELEQLMQSLKATK
jgi:hypothetical protein